MKNFASSRNLAAPLRKSSARHADNSISTSHGAILDYMFSYRILGNYFVSLDALNDDTTIDFHDLEVPGGSFGKTFALITDGMNPTG